MKKFASIVLAVVLLLCFGIGSSMAKNDTSGSSGKIENALENGSGHKYGISKHIRRPLFHKFINCVKSAELSDETTAAIKALLETYKTNQETQNGEMKTALIAYWEILMASPLDEDALASAEEIIANLKSKDLELKFDLTVSIRRLLTDDELAQVADCLGLDTETSETVIE